MGDTFWVISDVSSADLLRKACHKLPSNLKSIKVVVSPYRYLLKDEVKQIFSPHNVEFLPHDKIDEIMTEAVTDYTRSIGELADSWKIGGIPIEKFLVYGGEVPVWWFTQPTDKRIHGDLGRFFFWQHLCDYFSESGVSAKDVLFCTSDLTCAVVACEHAYEVMCLNSIRSRLGGLRTTTIDLAARYLPAAIVVYLMALDLIYWLKVRLFWSTAGIAKSAHSKKEVAYISFFDSTNWFNRGSGQAYDRYYMDIPNHEMENLVGVVYGIVLNPSRKVRRDLQANRYYKKIKPIFLLESFSNVKELARFRLWCVVAARRLTRPPSKSKSLSRIYLRQTNIGLLAGVPSTFRFYTALRDSLQRETVHKALTYSEVYPFGRAVSLACAHSGVPLLGWQHCLIFKNMVEYKYTEYELQHMPRPSALLIWGKQAQEHGQFLSSSSLRDYFVEVGGTRFHQAFVNLRNADRIYLRKDTVFVLVLPSEQDAVILPKLIIKNSQVFFSQGIRVLIKPHPSYGADTKKLLSNLEDSEGSVTLAEGNLAELIKNCRYVITSYSTATIECVLAGKPVLITTFLVPPGVSPFSGHEGAFIFPVYEETEFINAVKEEPWFKREWISTNELRNEIAKYTVPFDLEYYCRII